MRGKLSRMRRAWKLVGGKATTLRVEDPAEALTHIHWFGETAQRLELPVAMLRTPAGLDFGPDAPFVRALNGGGAEYLTAFFDAFQPTTLAEMYRLDMTDEHGADLPQWEVPWQGLPVRRPPRGEWGLSASEGVVHFGPCTAKKIALEMRRLNLVRTSIEAKGYRPSARGDIEGYFLTDGQATAFVVMGGKHRAAALVTLGHSHIPVRMRPSMPRLIDRRLSAHWPLVTEGKVSQRLAEAVFDRFLEGQDLNALMKPPDKANNV